jgi:hypothetical protein
MASLFFCASPSWSAAQPTDALVAKARALNLAEKPAWAALTHSHKGKTLLKKSSLIITRDNFSLHDELEESIILLYGSSADPKQCRFPARNLWIARQLGLEPASMAHCAGLTEFLQRAPVEEVSLIYASENISQPSSMMGHILLKISGEDAEGNLREHAVSFFTDVNGINVPKIIYDSLVAGKTGYFALTPYNAKITAYLAAEQRNLWEYKLALDAQQLKLLQLHIWELKDANPAYFFDSYNCATLTYFLIASAKPEILSNRTYLMSPLDVVKNVHANEIISSVAMQPSNRWRLRMLSERFPLRVKRAVKASVDSLDVGRLPESDSAQNQFLIDSMAQAYNDFLFEKDEIDIDQWQTYQRQLNSLPRAKSQFLIDVSNYKNPLKAPNDGQLSIGLKHIDTGTYLQLGVLPISHRLIDDNRQFFSESELKLGEFSLLLSLEDADVELDTFQIYSATSYLPVNIFTGGISGKFRFGIEPHYDADLQRRIAGNIAGALGAAYSPILPITFFGTVNAGLGYAKSEAAYLYGGSEAGIIVNGAKEMKTILTIKQTYNQVESGSSYLVASLEHAKRLGVSFTLVGNAQYLKTEGITDLELSITLKYLF